MANKFAHGALWRGQHYIIGVPARDLNAEEAKQHGEAIREAEAAHGYALYDPAPAPPAENADDKGKTSQKKE